MWKNKAYRNAEANIEDARRKKAIELDLSTDWVSDDSEKLTELPNSLGKLPQLQSLNLCNNHLTALPDWSGQLTDLRTLKLSRNRLKTIPEWIGRLTQLETLYLDDNRLTALPTSLSGLVKLRTLNLAENRLTALPELLVRLINLRTLHLADNRLRKLPNGFGHLARLETLSIASNPIASLPDDFGDLQKLRSLTLGNTNIKSLPKSFSKLTSLQVLFLSDTLLTELPNWVGDLTHLEVLDLSNGHGCVNVWEGEENWSWSSTQQRTPVSLAELPSSMSRLVSLRELYLQGNEDLGIPVEVLGPDWDTVRDEDREPNSPSRILEYYFSTRADSGSPLREFKLLVVGRGGAGKTSLVRRLNGEPLVLDESETHGINISRLEFACHDGPVTARVWDFGGQHVLHAMHEFFLTARSLYLLVLGEREDMAERDAAYWLQLIRSYAHKAPVVVAVNKSTGRLREMDRESLEKNYGPILAWVPTECSEGFDTTIESLRTALTDAADNMREIRHLFPTKWWKVKQWIEGMADPYLDFDEYKKKCMELGEADEDQQEKLATWLNDLGIAINYADDERLHDTTVLRPDWLANGIYAILRANDPHHTVPLAREAILTADRLGPIYAGAERLKILNAVDYPEEMWPFLLRLMKLFQLAFPLDDLGETLLVPTLLPLEAPSGSDLRNEDRTRLRYECAVVPGPLLPKLLVRMYSLIDGKHHWRRGALLRYGDAQARVWTTQDERWIRVTAVGSADDRSELLTMIRVTLQELFAEYRDLRTTEQWDYNNEWVPRRTLEGIGVLEVENVRREVL